MIKFVLKYYLSFCLIFAAVFAVVNINKNDFQLSFDNQTTFEKTNIDNNFTKNFFSSNSEQENQSSNHIVFENEIDDDEIKSVKNNFNNRVSHLNIINRFGKTHYLSRVKNILPKYSLQANISKCWYILYRVFRI